MTLRLLRIKPQYPQLLSPVNGIKHFFLFILYTIFCGISRGFLIFHKIYRIFIKNCQKIVKITAIDNFLQDLGIIDHHTKAHPKRTRGSLTEAHSRQEYLEILHHRAYTGIYVQRQHKLFFVIGEGQLG